MADLVPVPGRPHAQDIINKMVPLIKEELYHFEQVCAGSTGSVYQRPQGCAHGVGGGGDGAPQFFACFSAISHNLSANF